MFRRSLRDDPGRIFAQGTIIRRRILKDGTDFLQLVHCMSISPNRVALVTGANKGIGFEIARQLGSNHGVTVIVGARDQTLGAEATARLRQFGVDAHFVQLDVTDLESIEAAARKIAQTFGGRLDILVNNAGVALDFSPPSQTDFEKLKATFAVNVFGTLAVTKAMLDLLKQSPSARIVNVSSGLGSITRTQNSDPKTSPQASYRIAGYNSSKAALNMQTVLFAAEFAAEGLSIKINSVAPGYTATDMNQHRGTQTVEQGAMVPVLFAMLPEDGPTGGFFDKDGPVPW
jgi:NAD(P)-dependent dehydrogenase (short-subunit alcohol dehydrogenase family)